METEWKAVCTRILFWFRRYVTSSIDDTLISIHIVMMEINGDQ